MSAAGSTYEQALAAAAAGGLDVRYPLDDELFVDIDNATALQTFRRIFPVLSTMLGAEILSQTPSKSGGGRQHIVVKFARAIGDIERILLQAVLGSDPMREVLSFIAVERKTTAFPTLFFEVKSGAV